jgi:hypothetical protein
VLGFRLCVPLDFAINECYNDTSLVDKKKKRVT